MLFGYENMLSRLFEGRFTYHQTIYSNSYTCAYATYLSKLLGNAGVNTQKQYLSKTKIKLCTCIIVI